MLDRVHKISEIIASFAIVGSLVFVGVQVSQNTNATRASNAQAAQTGWNEMSMTLATNNDLFDTMMAGIPPELRISLPDDAEARAFYYMSAGMKLMESNYLQWLDGNLSDDIWQGFRGALLDMFAGNNLWLAYWKGGQFSHSTKFQNLIIQVIEEAEALRGKLITKANASQT